MAISAVRVLFQDVWTTLTLNPETGMYEGGLTAPVTPQNGIPVTIQAVNDLGYQATAHASIDVRWEIIPPVVEITSPPDGSWYTDGQQPVTFTLRDEENGSGVDLSTLVFALDGQKLDSTSPGMACTEVEGGYDCIYTPPEPLADGPHTAVINVRDAAGNPAEQAERSWNIDTENPALSITYPPDNTITNQETAIVTGTAGDAGIGLESLVVNGVETNVENGVFTAEIPLTAGYNTITVTATDRLGHSSAVERTLLCDPTPPIFSSVHIKPDLDAVTLGERFIVTVRMADSVRPNSKETVTGNVNGKTAAFVEGPELVWTTTVGRSEDDTYTVELYAYDEAGNDAVYSVVFPCGMESKWDWTELDYLNFWDLNRIERNTKYIYLWLKQHGYGAELLSIKTDWDKHDIPTRSDINRVRSNVDALQDSLFSIPDWRDIVYSNTVDRDQMNAIEYDLHLMDLWLEIASSTYKVYSGQIYAGMWA